MKNRQIAMGMDTTGAPLTKIAMPSSDCARSGADFAQADAGDDAQPHPEREMALEKAHRSGVFLDSWMDWSGNHTARQGERNSEG